MSRQQKTSPDIHLSIVSHGQWPLVKVLLNDLEILDSKERLRVTLTINIPEAIEICDDDFSFPVRLIKNTQAKGFAENHNQAFDSVLIKEESLYFFVINPDIRITQDVFLDLIHQLDSDNSIGVVAPNVLNDDGRFDDSMRALPTPWIILKKLMHYPTKYSIDNQKSIFKPDWVAGMFMGFRSDVFKCIQGFDDKFFLYYEDVDICSRLWLNGFQVQANTTLSVLHNARRDSHGKYKFLKWHLMSMLRFFVSSVYRQAKKFHYHRIV